MTRDATACDYCFGDGREHANGDLCRYCSGTGLAPGVLGYFHQRAFSIRLGAICNGWAMADFDQLTTMVEKAAAWTKEAGFKLEDFVPTDRTRIRMMIERQVLLGVEGGHFADVGILPEDLGAIRRDLQKSTT